MRGIYKITNIKNNKVYIGESLSIVRRWEEHTLELNKNMHINNKLQKDWNNFGGENFEFQIIAVLDETIPAIIDKILLLLFEELYIKNLKTIESGYNIEMTLDDLITGRRTDFSPIPIPKEIKDKSRFVCKIKKELEYQLDIGNLVNFGGVIFKKSTDLKPLSSELNLTLSQLKEKLIDSEVIVFRNSGYYFNKNILNKKDDIKKRNRRWKNRCVASLPYGVY